MFTGHKKQYTHVFNAVFGDLNIQIISLISCSMKKLALCC